MNQFLSRINWDISWYSFFSVKMNIVDLVKLSSKLPLETNYTFDLEQDRVVDGKVSNGLGKVDDFLSPIDYSDAEDADNLITRQIQRRQRKERLLSIWKYIRYNNFPFFPTNIVGAINDPGISFENKWGDVFEITLEKSENSIFLVDGQHRVLWSVIRKEDLPKEILSNDHDIDTSIRRIGDEDYVFANPDMEVMVTILVNVPIELQASIFQTINFEAKRISPSMYYNLFDFKSYDISWTELSHSVVKKLIESDEKNRCSIWSRIFLSEIHKEVEKEKNNLLTISQSAFADNLDDFYKVGHIFYFYTKEDGKYPGTIFRKEEYPEYFVDWEIDHYNAIKPKLAALLHTYFSIIAEIYSEEWNDPKISQVSKSTWISVFMNLFEAIIVLWILHRDEYAQVSKLEDIDLDEATTKSIIGEIAKEISFKDLWWSAGLGLQSQLTRKAKNLLKNKYSSFIGKIVGDNQAQMFDSGSSIQGSMRGRFMVRNDILRLIELNLIDNKGYIPKDEYYQLAFKYILQSL